MENREEEEEEEEEEKGVENPHEQGTLRTEHVCKSYRLRLRLQI
jgi:hypothetical protein